MRIWTTSNGFISRRADELEAQGLSREVALEQAARQTREMSLRASIGAGRGRLLQQVLVESGMLTLAGTVVGLVCARLALPFIVGILTTNENPVYLDTRLDWRAVAFVAAVGCLTTVLFGLAPAIRASAVSPAGAAALGDRSQTAHAGVAHSRVATQIAFSLMILFVAGLIAGLAGGVYFATFVRAFLYEVEPFRAVSFVRPVLGLLPVGFLATWFPARRASRVDPVEALRAE